MSFLMSLLVSSFEAVAFLRRRRVAAAADAVGGARAEAAELRSELQAEIIQNVIQNEMKEEI